MRHGHKSKSQRFDGFKVSVSTEQSSEMIMDVADLAANDRDGTQLVPTIERVEQHTGVTVERVIADGAYNSGDNLAACAHYPGHAIDLVGPFHRPSDPEVDKSAFQIDLDAQTATCPEGHTAEGKPARDNKKRPVLRFTFPRAVCEACPRFGRCVRSKRHGRTVTTHAHEALLRKARIRQETAASKALYRLRSAVERKIGEVVHHGIRDTRYLGARKRHLQRLWTGAAVNLKRLFALAEARDTDLRAALVGLGPPAVQTVAA
jgi:hypothetical protein